MGYIVDLTVILDDIFRTTGGNVTENDALKVMGTHFRSRCRDNIHQDIRKFVTEAFSIRFAVPQNDLVLEKIIDLIKQYRGWSWWGSHHQSAKSHISTY